MAIELDILNSEMGRLMASEITFCYMNNTHGYTDNINVIGEIARLGVNFHYKMNLEAKSYLVDG